jgi:hypothetical protein
MTLKIETIEQTECDICHAKDIRQRKYVVVIKKNNWDICFNCFDKFNNVMSFLNITVGLDIKYQVVELEKGE